MGLTAIPRPSEDHDEKDDIESCNSRDSLLQDSTELGSVSKSNTAIKFAHHWQSTSVAIGLCASNLVLLVITLILGARLYSVDDCKDPTLSVWCKFYILAAQVRLLRLSQRLPTMQSNITRSISSPL